MLVSVKQLLKKAEKENYAVGSFNSPNLEITKAIVMAAEAQKSPVIISTSESEINYAGIEFISKIIRLAGHEAKVPVALNLDHGKSLKMALMCMAAGYTSIHVDGSSLDFNDNVSLTLSVAEVAKKEKISVEGELGHVSGSSQLNKEKLKDLKIEKTDPSEALAFVKETGIDVLAVAIGNAHGIYQDEPELDFLRLKKIKEKIKIPLVLHGGSGIPGKDIKKSIRQGIRKININTEIRMTFTGALKASLDQNPEEITPHKIFPPVIHSVKRVVEEKINLFGSKNKA